MAYYVNVKWNMIIQYFKVDNKINSVIIIMKTHVNID